MYDEDLDEDDETRDPAYTSVVGDPTWTSTRKLAIEGTVFRHQKHPEDVEPGVQHKLFVWLCETRRPRQRCPCGLYTLTWLDDDTREKTHALPPDLPSASG